MSPWILGSISRPPRFFERLTQLTVGGFQSRLTRGRASKPNLPRVGLKLPLTLEPQTRPCDCSPTWPHIDAFGWFSCRPCRTAKGNVGRVWRSNCFPSKSTHRQPKPHPAWHGRRHVPSRLGLQNRCWCCHRPSPGHSCFDQNKPPTWGGV